MVGEGCYHWYAPRLVDELIEFGHQILKDELDPAVVGKDTPHMTSALGKA